MNIFADTWSYLTDPASWTGPGGMTELLVQQLWLTFTAMLLALLLGLPLALWLGHLGRGGFAAINTSNVGRAVPTFALLALLVIAPWPGVATFGPYGRAGIATLIALTLFALPPIITNGYVAIREVPAEMKESATGMGMTGWQRFTRVELPLAAPLVVSGIRLALVQVWATATIAAMVAGPGLGNVITSGFYRSNYPKGIAGAVVVALVALVLELAMALAQRAVDPDRRTTTHPRDGSPRPPRPRHSGGMRTRRILAAAITSGVIALAGCASDDLSNDSVNDGKGDGSGGGTAVSISGQNFPEAELVAQMYAQLLSAHDYAPEVKLVGTRDVYLADFPQNIDIVPEYVGGVVEFLNIAENGANAEPLTSSGAEQSIQAAQKLLDEKGITLLDPSEAADVNAFFVTQEYADSEGVSTLSDMKGKSVTLAAMPDCEQRIDCGAGLRDVYGITLKKILPLGYGTEQVYTSVLDDESQMGLTASTDGTLESQGLVLLEDDQKIQPAQNLVPAVSQEFLQSHKEIEEPLNDLMAALTTEKLTELNGRVAVDREKPEDVAKEFLEDEGLI